MVEFIYILNFLIVINTLLFLIKNLIILINPINNKFNFISQTKIASFSVYDIFHASAIRILILIK
jgi:hypothetical protein